MKYETGNTTLSFSLALLVGTLIEIEHMRYLKQYTSGIQGTSPSEKGTISVRKYLYIFFCPGIVYLSLLLKSSKSYISNCGL